MGIFAQIFQNQTLKGTIFFLFQKDPKKAKWQPWWWGSNVFEWKGVCGMQQVCQNRIGTIETGTKNDNLNKGLHITRELNIENIEKVSYYYQDI